MRGFFVLVFRDTTLRCVFGCPTNPVPLCRRKATVAQTRDERAHLLNMPGAFLWVFFLVCVGMPLLVWLSCGGEKGAHKRTLHRIMPET